MSLTKSNLYSESYTILKNFIENNITDPKHRYKKKWIYASMPNINDKGFTGYPFIVITLDINEDKKSFDRDISQKNFRVLLSIYAKDATDIDTISNSLFNQLNSTDLSEFKSIELSSSPLSWDLDMKGEKILWRNFGLICKTRI